jgi:hypothetical protein
MARRKLLDDELKRFAEEHVIYEANMLRGLGTKLFNRHHKDDPLVENACPESFTIHCRLILDFLYVDEPRVPTDAAAGDYFEDDRWQKARPAVSERLDTINSRVGKEIVHLSYKRLDIPEDEKGWVVVSLGLELAGTLALWASLVPEHLQPEDWIDRFFDAAGALKPGWEKGVFRASDLPSVPTQGLRPQT